MLDSEDAQAWAELAQAMNLMRDTLQDVAFLIQDRLFETDQAGREDAGRATWQIIEAARHRL